MENCPVWTLFLGKGRPVYRSSLVHAFPCRGETICTPTADQGCPARYCCRSGPDGHARYCGTHPSLRDRPLLRGRRRGAGGSPRHQRTHEPAGVPLQAPEGHQLVGFSSTPSTVAPIESRSLCIRQYSARVPLCGINPRGKGLLQRRRCHEYPPEGRQMVKF
jgi:hypothetical protein